MQLPLKEYTYKYSASFNQICKTIFERSPITFCSIGRIFNDGTYTGFMSDPVWTDMYLEKHYLPTLKIWTQHIVNQAKIGFDLWSISTLHSTNNDTKLLREDCNLFHYNNGINIIDKNPDYYQVATFSTPKIDGIDSFFVEKIDVLRNYILFIKEQILSDNELSKEFTTSYILPDKNGIESKRINLPMNDIELTKYYVGYPLPEDAYLTKRELDCLLPFILGIPKKNIANQLAISIRTIETHLDNIKNKCHSNDLSNLKSLFFNNKFILALLNKTL